MIGAKGIGVFFYILPGVTLFIFAQFFSWGLVSKNPFLASVFGAGVLRNRRFPWRAPDVYFVVSMNFVVLGRWHESTPSQRGG